MFQVLLILLNAFFIGILLGWDGCMSHHGLPKDEGSAGSYFFVAGSLVLQLILFLGGFYDPLLP